ncbi:MAG: WecB/TagA/CpsF family glycosyltransferase [Deltaproteobacteria bacterium]|nr:WecB/TagA/CpsF family glycosyltransferase [Deltaproteobacteria bacterium]
MRFPRMDQDEALSALMDMFAKKKTAGVCFPDMSTMVLTMKDGGFKRLLQKRMRVFNDGAGLAWAARRRGRPFPANLNGTDLCPRFLAALPKGTSVYLIGGQEGLARRARDTLQGRFGHLDFVGAHHGYLDDREEALVLDELRGIKPRVVLVGMGNPIQVEFIDRHLDDPGLEGTMFLAVGGLLNYWAGDLRRAPAWIRKSRLEWLYIVMQQPAKTRRYLFGIPRFLLGCLRADQRAEHDLPSGRGP